MRHLITGAVQPKLSMGNLKSLPLILPIGAGLKQMEVICESGMAVRRTMSSESATLAGLRDTLLPQLTSGRLRVNDAEQQVEAVV